MWHLFIFLTHLLWTTRLHSDGTACWSHRLSQSCHYTVQNGPDYINIKYATACCFSVGIVGLKESRDVTSVFERGAFGRGRALKALQLCSLRFHPHALHQCCWLKEFTNAAGGKWRLKPDAATTTFSHEDSQLPQENEWKSLSDCKRGKILDTVQLDAKRWAHCPDPGGSRQSAWSGSSAIPKSSAWCRRVWYSHTVAWRSVWACNYGPRFCASTWNWLWYKTGEGLYDGSHY